MQMLLLLLKINESVFLREAAQKIHGPCLFDFEEINFALQGAQSLSISYIFMI